jgi:hypothetical protein
LRRIHFRQRRAQTDQPTKITNSIRNVRQIRSRQLVMVAPANPARYGVQQVAIAELAPYRGRAGTMTHDYKRHGTIDLFVALDIGTGRVLTHLRKRHAGADVLEFFKQIDAVPRGLSVHVELDNLSAHTAPEVKRWLAHKDRRRWHLHVTATSSWLNLVERWFKELTDKRLRRGVFTGVAELTAAITEWAEHWNADPKPFI